MATTHAKPQSSAQGQSENLMTLHVASDHAGFDLKEQLKARLPQYNWIDHGPIDGNRVDYPDYADRVAAQISTGGGRGILICGSGQGMAMRANRYPHVRAALAWNEDSIRLAREHNDANILCLGARLLPPELCEKLVELFVHTPFEGGRHADRVKKLGDPTGC